MKGLNENENENYMRTVYLSTDMNQLEAKLTMLKEHSSKLWEFWINHQVVGKR